MLVDFKKIIDQCTSKGSPNVQPAPSSHHKDHKRLGLAFDKVTSYNYLLNCDTVGLTLILLVIVDGMTILIPQDTMFSNLCLLN